MRHAATSAYLEKQRSKGRKRRERDGHPPTVHYFHQVNDPYSHLVIQKLDQLKARYKLSFQPHLTSEPDAAYQGSADHFAQWALADALSVAADYNTHFAPAMDAPSVASVALANRRLAAHLDQDDFASIAIETGTALWHGKTIDPTTSLDTAQRALQAGNTKRAELGHYQGGMFYFDGEWFWGIDRIRLLEQRLSAEGFDSSTGAPCVPQPTPQPMPQSRAGKSTAGIQLEYFPSLRSPYTAIGHRRVLDLIAETGVDVKVRPVMPMLMRGIPAPREKQRYIITDAAREGREFNAPFGRIVDPFGEPVKRAFALFPQADALGKGMDFVTAYLNAAWFDGVDITTEAGLKTVTTNAGLTGQAVTQNRAGNDWEMHLTNNLATLTQQNLWGVPSFRVTGGTKRDAYACWGQDRIWRVASEIARRI